MSSSRKYAVVGLGVVAGPQPNRTRRQVAAEAVRLAIAAVNIPSSLTDHRHLMLGRTEPTKFHANSPYDYISF
jgi:hypothetical protein